MDNRHPHHSFPEELCASPLPHPPAPRPRIPISIGIPGHSTSRRPTPLPATSGIGIDGVRWFVKVSRSDKRKYPDLPDDGSVRVFYKSTFRIHEETRVRLVSNRYGGLCLYGSALSVLSYFAMCPPEANIMPDYPLRGQDVEAALNAMPRLVGYPDMDSLFRGERPGRPPQFALNSVELTADMIHEQAELVLDAIAFLPGMGKRTFYATSRYPRLNIHGYLKDIQLKLKGILLAGCVIRLELRLTGGRRHRSLSLNRLIAALPDAEPGTGVLFYLGKGKSVRKRIDLTIVRQVMVDILVEAEGKRVDLATLNRRQRCLVERLANEPALEFNRLQKAGMIRAKDLALVRNALYWAKLDQLGISSLSDLLPRTNP
jgi:hypothetical protein